MISPLPDATIMFILGCNDHALCLNAIILITQILWCSPSQDSQKPMCIYQTKQDCLPSALNPLHTVCLLLIDQTTQTARGKLFQKAKMVHGRAPHIHFPFTILQLMSQFCLGMKIVNVCSCAAAYKPGREHRHRTAKATYGGAANLLMLTSTSCTMHCYKGNLLTAAC